MVTHPLSMPIIDEILDEVKLQYGHTKVGEGQEFNLSRFPGGYAAAMVRWFPTIVPVEVNEAVKGNLNPNEPIMILSAWSGLIGVPYQTLCIVIAHAYMSAYSVEENVTAQH